MESITDGSERCPLRKIMNNRDCWNVYRFSCFFLKYLFIRLNVSFYLLMIDKLSKIRTWFAFCFSVKKFQPNLDSSAFAVRKRQKSKEKEVKSQPIWEFHGIACIIFDCFTIDKSSMMLVSKYIKNNQNNFLDSASFLEFHFLRSVWNRSLIFFACS